MVTTTKTATKAPMTTKVVEKEAPAAKPVTKPVAKKVASAKKPVAKKPAPVVKSAAEPITKPVTKPVAKKVTPAKKPVAKKTPVKRPTPVVKPAETSVAKPTVAPVAKPAPISKPVAKKVAPAKKSVAKKVPAKKPVAKKVAPVAKPTIEKVAPVTASVNEKVVPTTTPVRRTIRKERNIFACYANAFKKYFDFKGRTSRWGYWSFVLVNFVISFILGILAIYFVPYLDTAYSLLVFIPGVALSFRRLHDVNKSGWWFGVPMFIMIVAAMLAVTSFFRTYVNPEYIDPNGLSMLQVAVSLIYSLAVLVSFCFLLYVFVLSFFKGTKGANKYGAEPAI